MRLFWAEKWSNRVGEKPVHFALKMGLGGQLGGQLGGLLRG